MWDRLLDAQASPDPTLAALLDVAVAEFSARSFGAVTVADLAAASGIGKHVLPVLRLQGGCVHRRGHGGHRRIVRRDRHDVRRADLCAALRAAHGSGVADAARVGDQGVS